ncbi:late expression factor 5 [Diatraea saccharalis granulovirus]|uniref:Late expression factor 5 n=1 Tax=Diatraea saccharalis granulovirus TaxID=1675862 RepID=A0A0R7EYY7_9BBAC|nr:late expression factor 5 [Diatraea saccharalis granulovirus]AKN80805.1 late expression factor 5 [Diatraea saccharalis granulovirus]
MSFDQSPAVKQHGPSIHLFEIFKKFRQEHDYDGLVDYLITNYPENLKNRTFNFHNTGHTFHTLYAYVPSPSNKERKQIRLDCIEKLLQNTKNDFKLYEDLLNLRQDKCPCELIKSRLNDNIVYNESLKNKNFDTKPYKLKKEPIDHILFKYSINWKNSLNKRCSNVRKRKKINEESYVINEVEDESLLSTSLHPLNGFTIKRCNHVFVVEERQLRAGDEAVSFVRFCKICGLK